MRQKTKNYRIKGSNAQKFFFIFLFSKSHTHMGLVCAKNASKKFSRLGTFQFLTGGYSRLWHSVVVPANQTSHMYAVHSWILCTFCTSGKVILSFPHLIMVSPRWGKKLRIAAKIVDFSSFLENVRMETGRYSCPCWPGKRGGRQVDIPAYNGQGGGRETGR